MAIYLKLGPKATVFVDYITGIKILKADVIAVSNLVSRSPKIKKALAGGHLETATKAEFEKGQPEAPEEPKAPETSNLDKMTNAELLAFYIKSYEVGTADIKMFKALNKKNKVKELNALEEE